jgi:rhodanese-related sulfurtransferase
MYPHVMRKTLLAAALAIATMAGCQKSDNPESATASANAPAEDNIPSMTVDEVDHALAAKAVQVVDCNHEKLRKRKGVVPGAILISDNESYAASELPADKATKLVFYCADPG